MKSIFILKISWLYFVFANKKSNKQSILFQLGVERTRVIFLIVRVMLGMEGTSFKRENKEVSIKNSITTVYDLIKIDKC